MLFATYADRGQGRPRARLMQKPRPEGAQFKETFPRLASTTIIAAFALNVLNVSAANAQHHGGEWLRLHCRDYHNSSPAELGILARRPLGTQLARQSLCVVVDRRRLLVFLP